MTQPTDLAEAVRLLTNAMEQVAQFHAGLPSDGDEPSYYDHGRDAIETITNLGVELQTQQQHLIRELAADDLERQRRVNELLTKQHTSSEGQPTPGRDHAANHTPPSSEGAHR